MNLPSQPLSSGESAQQPPFLPSEETPIQPSTASDTSPEKTEEQQPTFSASEDSFPEYTSPEETGEPSALSPSVDSSPEHATISEITDPKTDEDLDKDEGEDFKARQPGIFIKRSLLITIASVVVVLALVAALLVFVNRPKDPPADWLSSYTPPAGTNGPTKILYYLHWTNQNGDLKGELRLAANVNGATQSLTAPATGLYNRENHIIYMVIIINGQPDTLTGTINEQNDTLTLNQANSTNKETELVFHTSSVAEYQQATKKLGSGTK